MNEQEAVAALWRYYNGHVEANGAITGLAFARAMAQANEAAAKLSQYTAALKPADAAHECKPNLIGKCSVCGRWFHGGQFA